MSENFFEPQGEGLVLPFMDFPGDLQLRPQAVAHQLMDGGVAQRLLEALRDPVPDFEVAAEACGMTEALPQLSQLPVIQAQGVVRAGAEGEKAGKPLLFVQGQPVAHCPAVTAEQGGYFLAGPHLVGLDQIEGMDSLRDSLGTGFGKKRLQLLCTFQDGRQAAIHGEPQIKQSNHSSWIVSTRKLYNPLIERGSL